MPFTSKEKAMSNQIRNVKGTRDILPGESEKWDFVETLIREKLFQYGYAEIRTPIFEETAVFTRGIGTATDIVGKEMYTFFDKGETSLTLRPEMTAPVMRAFLQHNIGQANLLTKLYYLGPMFRQERPQAGRYRQFHQFGYEAIGIDNPAIDVEIIALASDIFQSLGIDYLLKINSVGDEESRVRYRNALQAYLRDVFPLLSEDSKRRVESNPMRVLDSKLEQDRSATNDAPRILEYLSSEADEHFTSVCKALSDAGIRYEVDFRLVRGLDYYTHTAFEFLSADLGSQDALGGGGRYNGLSEQLGGKPIPGVGFAAGIERILMVLEKNEFQFAMKNPSLFIIALDVETRRWALSTALELRKCGIATELDYANRSLKAQMREANRLGVARVLIVGSDELARGVATMKDMHSGEQSELPLKNVLNHFTKSESDAAPN